MMFISEKVKKPIGKVVAENNGKFGEMDRTFFMLVFLMLELLVEYLFLTTFFGLYFNHQFLHITLYNFSSSYRFL